MGDLHYDETLATVRKHIESKESMYLCRERIQTRTVFHIQLLQK